MLKTLSESFDTLRTNGERFEIAKKFSVHAEPFDVAQDRLVEAFFRVFLAACYLRLSLTKNFSHQLRIFDDVFA